MSQLCTCCQKYPTENTFENMNGTISYMCKKCEKVSEKHGFPDPTRNTLDEMTEWYLTYHDED